VEKFSIPNPKTNFITTDSNGNIYEWPIDSLNKKIQADSEALKRVLRGELAAVKAHSEARLIAHVTSVNNSSRAETNTELNKYIKYKDNISIYTKAGDWCIADHNGCGGNISMAGNMGDVAWKNNERTQFSIKRHGPSSGA